MAEAFVYDHLRTPRGRGKATGTLHEVKPVDLAVGLLNELETRNPTLDTNRIDDVVLLRYALSTRFDEHGPCLEEV